MLLIFIFYFNYLKHFNLFEFANLGRVHDAVLTVRPIEPPLMRDRIVGTKHQTFDWSGGAINHFNGVQLGAPKSVTSVLPAPKIASA